MQLPLKQGIVFPNYLVSLRSCPPQFLHASLQQPHATSPTMPQRMVRLFVALTLLLATAQQALPVSAAEPGKIDFNRDIRPILSNNCIQCHGPDAAERKGGTDGLRLDVRDGALADLGGYAAIVPGAPAKSALIERVSSTDPDLNRARS
jgi:hypothetical protein